MVYLISGKRDEGKTTKLKQLYEEQSNAAGFIAEKVHDCGRITTYNMVNLKNGEIRVLARMASLPLLEGWGEDFIHGPFRFSHAGFEWARQLLNSAIEAGAEAFFIDELGKLELNGKGHAELIENALKTGMNLYIAIRDINVKDAVKAFGIGEYALIQVDP
jgi:nucleoside-triphosphatase THEP1